MLKVTIIIICILGMTIEMLRLIYMFFRPKALDKYKFLHGPTGRYGMLFYYLVMLWLGIKIIIYQVTGDF